MHTSYAVNLCTLHYVKLSDHELTVTIGRMHDILA